MERSYIFRPDGTKKTMAERIADQQAKDAKQAQAPAPFDYMRHADGALKTRTERFADYASYSDTRKQLAAEREAAAHVNSPYTKLIADLENPTGATGNMKPAQRAARIAMWRAEEQKFFAERDAAVKEAARLERVANDPNTKKMLDMMAALRKNEADYTAEERKSFATLQALADEGEFSKWSDIYLQVAESRDARWQAAYDAKQAAAAKAKEELDAVRAKQAEHGNEYRTLGATT